MTVFDRAEALERCRGKEGLLAKLIRIYLEDAAQQGAVLDAACAAGDVTALERAAHRLKGSALNLSLKRVAEAAARLEDEARTERTAEAAALWPALRAALEEAAAALRPFLSQP
ncbi:MAG: Hpt domain-containing protein [Verrucomicrobium sp.]|nr:Hpt domain-containing protein [Verrucomicrobium sp.]